MAKTSIPNLSKEDSQEDGGFGRKGSPSCVRGIYLYATFTIYLRRLWEKCTVGLVRNSKKTRQSGLESHIDWLEFR